MSIRQGDNIDKNLIQAYIVRLFTMYSNKNIRDYSLWQSIHHDFENFTEDHWSVLDSDQWDLVQKVCYTQGIWLDHPGKKETCPQIMYNMMQLEDYYGDWTMKEIKWVEMQYKTLSLAIQCRKDKLLGANVSSQTPALPFSSAANQGYISTTPPPLPIPPPQPEGLFQQPARQPTSRHQSEPQAQNPEISISQDVRNDYQPHQHQYPHQSQPHSSAQLSYQDQYTNPPMSDYHQQHLPPSSNLFFYPPNQPTYPPAPPPDRYPYPLRQPAFGPSYPTYPSAPQAPDQFPNPPNQPTYQPVRDAQPQYSREVALLDKSYKEEEKFGGTSDNFDFKINTFSVLVAPQAPAPAAPLATIALLAPGAPLATIPLVSLATALLAPLAIATLAPLATAPFAPLATAPPVSPVAPVAQVSPPAPAPPVTPVAQVSLLALDAQLAPYSYNESEFTGLLFNSSATVKSTDKKSLALAGRLACSYVLSHGVVFASKPITITSMSTDYNLWHAFKGGTNNFGIVTCYVTVRIFFFARIRSDFLHILASYIAKIPALYQSRYERVAGTGNRLERLKHERMGPD